MGKTEYVFEKDFWSGKWKLVPKKGDGGGFVIALIILFIVVIALMIAILTLPLWLSLLGFKINPLKRYYASIASFITLIYFYIDISNKWLSGYLLLGYQDSENVMKEGLFGPEYLKYFYIANSIGVVLSLYFIYTSYKANKENQEIVEPSATPTENKIENISKNETINNQSKDTINEPINNDIYYYAEDNSTKGPFPLNQITNYINHNSLISKNGGEWQNASSIPEIEKQLKYSSNPSEKTQSNSSSKNYTTTILVTTGVLLIVAFAVFYFSKNNKEEKEEAKLESALIDTSSISNQPEETLQPEENSINSPTTPFYIVNVYAVKTLSEAKNKAQELKNNGYNSSYLWIPDYKSLSGAQYYSVYVGPFYTQYECEEATENYKKIDSKAYGLLVSNENVRVQINGIGNVNNGDQNSTPNYSKIEPYSISSNGYLKSSGNLTYNPTNVNDEQLNTWWTPYPNREGNGAWIKLNFNENKNVCALEILNGSHYPDYPNYGDLYFKNNRLTKIEIEYSDGTTVTVNLDEVDKIQKITLTQKTTSYLIIRALDWQQGNTWNDLCISYLKAIEVN
jgi:hypothetical protein